MATHPTDKAGVKYWEADWSRRDLPPPFNPGAPNLSACTERLFDELFRECFEGLRAPGARLMEVGCGASAWLPYLGKAYGFEVSGIDYAPIGIAQSQGMLDREGVTGKLYQTDLFAPPAELLGNFDVVVSNGVLEHFEDTARCLKAIGNLARSGGRVLTVIPNMSGALGMAQRWLNRSIYDVHVPLDREMLLEAHRAAGLTTISCRYLQSTNFGVCNAGGQPGVRTKIARGFHRVLVDGSRFVWQLERFLGPFEATQLFSPYVVAIAQKP